MKGLTKQHFNKIAEIVNRRTRNKYSPEAVVRVGEGSTFLKKLADYFATQNPDFNKELFIKACLK